MERTQSKSHLKILFLLSLILLVQSKLGLDHSDQEALLIVQKQLGVKAKPLGVCNSAGILCEPRGENSSYVLRITRIVYKSQQLKGSLSPAIGKLSELKQLSLSRNQLLGEIPPQIAKLQRLEILDLGENRFSGNVFAGLSELTKLRVLNLSSNKLSGDLSFLKSLTNLEELSLFGNLFVGKIPSSLKSFTNLGNLNVSGNILIQDQESALSEVEYYEKNFLPKRFLFAENSFIREGKITAMAPSSEPIKHKKKKKKAESWIFGFLAGSVAGLITGLIASVLFRIIKLIIKGGNKETGLAIFSPLIKKPEDLAFLENEDGLASLEVIGRGGCGEVYKAELPGSNGKEIAIKKVIQPSKDAADLTEEDSKTMNKKMRQIRSEIQTVGQIRHRNLLPLVAHMPRPDCHYLVYEYMRNGSLQDLIVKASKGEKDLDWLARHRIALGIASGLEYLHINHTPRIIHRDLKPANVLLDDDMEARISDFGLAKAMPEAYTHLTSSNLVGTLGYIAPEYHQTLKFTDKCDIYSFGMVLAILVMGKLPTDDFFQHTDEMNLVMWMRNVMTSDEPKRAIDPRLMGNGYEEQMLLVLKIACFCTLENPKERPNSKDVRAMLSQIAH